MDSVQLLEEALETARRIGFEVREEALDGVGGGVCRISGKKLLFLDSAATTRQRLEHTLRALTTDSQTDEIILTAALRSALDALKPPANSH